MSHHLNIETLIFFKHWEENLGKLFLKQKSNKDLSLVDNEFVRQQYKTFCK